MPKMIYKIKLEMKTSQILELHEGSEMIAAGSNGDDLCIWVVDDNSRTRYDREIKIYGDQMQMPIAEEMTHTHVGSVNIVGYAWHVFAGREIPGYKFKGSVRTDVADPLAIRVRKRNH